MFLGRLRLPKRVATQCFNEFQEAFFWINDQETLITLIILSLGLLFMLLPQGKMDSWIEFTHWKLFLIRLRRSWFAILFVSYWFIGPKEVTISLIGMEVLGWRHSWQLLHLQHRFWDGHTMLKSRPWGHPLAFADFTVFWSNRSCQLIKIWQLTTAG